MRGKISKKDKLVLDFKDVNKKDIGLVGGKNASLGEMIQAGVPVPPGFAVTSTAYKRFLEYNDLDEKIEKNLEKMELSSLKSLRKTGKSIRKMIISGSFPKDMKKEILSSYKKLKKKGSEYVAVRSSATAEDLADASFAGQQETYLNIKTQKDLLDGVKRCFASLFTDRAISYREDRGFDHLDVYLSVGVQKMVEPKSAGVMFTIEPDSGHKNIISITANWGLGESVVQGSVTPDQFYVLKPTRTIISKDLGAKDFKIAKGKKENVKKNTTRKEKESFSLNNKDIIKLAKHGIKIEKHYGSPQDIEWAKDKKTGKIYILQSRPETVHSIKKNQIENYQLKEKSRVLLEGKSIGRKISGGKVRIMKNKKQISDFKKGEILVADMTNPDYEPVMKLASGVVTDKGGSTSHAAIVSRELGIPAIVGTGEATKKLKDGTGVTLDCGKEVGKVRDGLLDYTVSKTNLEKIPRTKTKVMVNMGVPESAFDVGQYPVDGVGLARQEFIISSYIGEHPLSLLEKGKGDYYANKLAEGIGKIGAAFYPRPVIVRLSDFKSNEYRTLKNGEKFEPEEENPMIGWRGASRYLDEKFEKAFKLECQAIKKVREEMKLKNINIMVPFCRTVEEGKKVKKLMKKYGIKKDNSLDFYVMAEIPSNIILADKFSKIFDGFSIGSNDLTQLTLGVDRDNSKISGLFDERNKAVKESIKDLIKSAHRYKKKVGICGDAPSSVEDYARFLVEAGIDSISVTPDVFLRTKLRIARQEQEKEQV